MLLYRWDGIVQGMTGAWFPPDMMHSFFIQAAGQGQVVLGIFSVGVDHYNFFNSCYIRLSQNSVLSVCRLQQVKQLNHLQFYKHLKADEEIPEVRQWQNALIVFLKMLIEGFSVEPAGNWQGIQ